MKVSFRWSGTLVVALATIGCGPTTQSQLTRCQNEKKTLLTRVVDEQKRAESLSTQNEQLASRLSDSEKQLARLYQQSSGRYVSSTSPLSAPPPTVPSTSLSERPNRLIPLGSPSLSSGLASPSPSSPPSTPRPATRSLRTGRLEDTNDLATGQPSLAAPANGRSESGWLPKGGAASRSTAEAPSTFEGTQRPSGSPRR